MDKADKRKLRKPNEVSEGSGADYAGAWEDTKNERFRSYQELQKMLHENSKRDPKDPKRKEFEERDAPLAMKWIREQKKKEDTFLQKALRKP